MNDNEPLTLGGRTFKPIKNSTFEHDIWLMERVRAAGLDSVVMEEDMHPMDFAKQLLSQVYASGKLFELLAGLLIPVETASQDWTPELATATAAFLRKLHEPADKELLNALLPSAIIGFFTSGLCLFQISPSCSGTAKPLSE